MSRENRKELPKVKKARDALRAKASKERSRKKAKEKVQLRKKITTPIEKSRVGTLMSDETREALPIASKRMVDENIIFQPNEGPQTDFLSAPENDVLYGGAAGGGKSMALIVEPLRYAHKAAHRALILRKTMPELRELIDKSRELYPKAFPGAKFKEQEKTWHFPSGAKMEFGYLDRDADVYRYQGQAYSFIGFDEITHLATEFPWQYLGSRLRTTDPDIEVYLRCTANPGGVGHGWVKKRYVDPAAPNTSFKGRDGLTRRFIPALLKDNPYLHKDGRYEQMLNSLDEVSRRRLLNGDWNVNEGVAFPEFIRDMHTIEPFDIPTNWFRGKAADYGYSSPSAVLWFAVDPEDNTLVCYKELYVKGLTGETLAETILDMEMNEVTNISGVLDTAAWNRTGYSGPTIGQTLNQAGCSFRPADKNRMGGKIQIHERLKLAMSGRPKLVIFKTCKNLIRELESIPLSQTNSEDVDTTASDHAYDALRYYVMSRPRMTTPAERAGLIKQDVIQEAVDGDFFGY